MSSTPFIDADFPEKLQPLFTPKRYKVAYGGRGGAKSWGFARALILTAVEKPLRIICTREYQNSIQESVHQLLEDQIKALGLEARFEVQQKTILGINGSEFIFAGLKTNPDKVKSLEGADICWVEEAAKVSQESWKFLIPTIRKPGSEIWISFNPDEETDPTYQRFIINTPPDCALMPIGWRDNPWLPDVLKKEKDYLASVDPDGYANVWEGECVKHSQAQVLYGKWIVESFEPDSSWDGPYYGSDWGFANDPSTLIKCWVNKKRLYVEEEFWGLGVDINLLSERFDTVSGAKNHTIRADCSRPETISYMQQHGYPKLLAGPKWSGSVNDGIAHLRSYEKIIIHPRCKHTIQEARGWSYKVDRLTGDILPILADGDEHTWDAVRYALAPLIRQGAVEGWDWS